MPKTPSLKDFRRIVVKVGSSLLVDSSAGSLKRDWLASFVLLFSFLLAAPAASVESRYFRKGQESSAVIVFVHGFLGDAVSSWTNGNAYWPEMVAGDSTFRNTDIYVYEYPTRAAASDFSIDELADDMRIRLAADGVIAHSDLIFIAHSMGALITRSFLLKYRDAAARTQFLYLLSPPTTGSALAALSALVSGSPQLSKMKPLQSPDYLADLQRDWLAANFQFPTYCAYEKRRTLGILIVDQSSASNLCTRPLNPIDADHITISKPADRTSAQYQAFANAFLENSRARSTAVQPKLSFQYARLFGALEIPLLMKFLPAPAFQKAWSGYSTPKGKSWDDAVQTKLARFAQDLPFQEARPLLTEMWADVAGKETSAINIFWRASSAGKKERACFYMEAIIDGGSGNTADILGSLLPRNWEKSCTKIQKEFDERIGFTFLLIENNSSETIEDVSLFFRETYSANKVVEDFHDNWSSKEYRSSITSIPDAGALENLVGKFSTAQAAEASLKSRPINELKMSAIKPGEQRIVVLNIYFSNERNLPAGYLYGIYEFERAEYSSSRGRTSSVIRAPYLEKAARVAVPYGWFNQ